MRKQKLIKVLNRIADDKGSRPVQRDLKEYNFAPSKKTFINEFGSWEEAVEEAGYTTKRKSSNWEPTPNDKPTFNDNQTTFPYRNASLSVGQRQFVIKHSHIFKYIAKNYPDQFTAADIRHHDQYSKSWLHKSTPNNKGIFELVERRQSSNKSGNIWRLKPKVLTFIQQEL